MKKMSEKAKKAIIIGITIVGGGTLVYITIKSKADLIKCMAKLEKANGRIAFLEGLCEEKDAFFKEIISDGLRHGSSLAGKHMADRLVYLRGFV